MPKYRYYRETAITLTFLLFSIPRQRGGEGYTKNTAIKLVQKFGISEETAQHLARTYGTHAFDVCYLSKPTGKAWPRFGQVLVDGYPFVEAEIEYACKYEYVRTLKDMLTLR